MSQKYLKFTPEQFNTILNGILYRFANHIGVKDEEIIKQLQEFGKKMDEVLIEKAKENQKAKNEKSI